MVVVAYHGHAFFAPLQVPGGYLAVDLFFGLSGFVLAHAYAHRFASGLQTAAFMKARVIRLYPLYFLAAVMSVCSNYAAYRFAGGQFSTIAAITSLLMLPDLQSVPLYPMNYPAWSLFFELLVNLAYVVLWPKLTTKRLIAGLCFVAVLLGLYAFANGGVDYGSKWSGFTGGTLRVTFSFFAGVLLHRFRPRSSISPAAWGILLAMIAIFLLPIANRIAFDLLCIFTLFPALIWLAARYEPHNQTIFTWLGAISYAVYVLHYPALLAAERALSLLQISPDDLAPTSGFAFVSLLIAGCWATEVLYDKPIRDFASGRRAAKRNAAGMAII